MEAGLIPALLCGPQALCYLHRPCPRSVFLQMRWRREANQLAGVQALCPARRQQEARRAPTREGAAGAKALGWDAEGHRLGKWARQGQRAEPRPLRTRTVTSEATLQRVLLVPPAFARVMAGVGAQGHLVSHPTSPEWTVLLGSPGPRKPAAASSERSAELPSGLWPGHLHGAARGVGARPPAAPRPGAASPAPSIA